jgi:dihydroorotate dehydrogenase
MPSELNLSCPHVKGAGQSMVRSEAVSAVMRLLEASEEAIIPKLISQPG